MNSIFRFVYIGAAWLVLQAGLTVRALDSQESIRRGEAFLIGLIDPEMNLLPEYRGAKVYWLFHDNYLAAKVLAASHPEAASRIMTAIHAEGVTKSGKIEILFGEAPQPLPFRLYQLQDIRRVGGKLIRTEVVQQEPLKGWEEYADLLLMAAIAEEDPEKARGYWQAAIKDWDGKGFMDAAARHNHLYATYKLGLALIASSHLSPPAVLPDGLSQRLISLQSESGGWITDYDTAGKKIGLANVETTCLAVLGLKGVNKAPAKPGK